ncbi:hypothetical protein L1887_33105 [Cichorium endivia]|nr:hypothetical protein L1887_33105 [Cichorium endivia]
MLIVLPVLIVMHFTPGLSLCCFLSHCTHKLLYFIFVILTGRFLFIPPNTDAIAASNTNPADYLLVPLEEKKLSEYVRNLAYLDLCMCARIASSLTVRSLKENKEDPSWVAKIYGWNAATLSTLLAALLAVEAFLGSLSPVTSYEKHYSKTYSMADILRTSISQIVSNFYEDIASSYRDGSLEPRWITLGNLANRRRELLIQKL